MTGMADEPEADATPDLETVMESLADARAVIRSLSGLDDDGVDALIADDSNWTRSGEFVGEIEGVSNALDESDTESHSDDKPEAKPEPKTETKPAPRSRRRPAGNSKPADPFAIDPKKLADGSDEASFLAAAAEEIFAS